MTTGRVMRNTILFLIMVLPAPALAADLVCSGRQAVNYVSSNTVQEFTIPTTNPPLSLRFSAEGADGGDAEAGNSNQCQSFGGNGAVATAVFEVGSDPGQLEPGGTLRFIIGQAGENADRNFNNGDAAGSGGGGSAVLYQPVGGGTWEILVSGGGGGGAYQDVNIGICSPQQDGIDGQLNECGADGVDINGVPAQGGCGGNAGENETSGGGGGGAFEGAGGSRGGIAGFDGGGSGGSGTHDGGWGFGGGGASAGSNSDRFTGGGGGYSGGGSGKRGSGGGGGSFINTVDFMAAGNATPGDNSPANGHGSYECIGANAECANAFFIQDSPGAGMPSAVGSVGDPNTADGASSCESPPLPDDWYAYTPGCDSQVTVRVDNSTAFNLAAFDGCGGNELDCDRGTFFPVPHLAEITWSASAGQTYLIRISHGGPLAQYFLFVSSAPLMPANDDVGSAQAMGLGETVRAQFCGATNDGMSACAPTERDVWFSYTSPTECDQIIELDSSVAASSFSVHPSPGGPEVQCQDNPWGVTIGPLEFPTMTWSQPADTTYYIRASSDSSDALTFAMTGLSLPTPPNDVTLEVVDPTNTALVWDELPCGQVYDAIRGDIASLQIPLDVVDLGAVICLEDDSFDITTAPDHGDSGQPALGQGFFYVVRVSGGSYGTGSAGFPRAPSAGACP